ncbi:MAG TPA: PAS domain S-box protein, partial [Steroidobacteraceae bacterium]|nr:PAS domain S-box protein [Steroidobacteraceae bacterium]
MRSLKNPRLALNGRLRASVKNEGLASTILRLGKNAPESLAIQSGEIDAIIDPHNGHVILLPEAQAALVEGKARFRSLVELSTDGYWEQDEQYRFVSHTGAAIGNTQAGTGILGKTLWELSFDDGQQIDWPTYRTQLAWRAIFRDLELRCLDQHGELRIISISGEPLFAVDGGFKGYRGITRDVTDRVLLQSAAPVFEPFASTILDSLAAQVCVLDADGTIVKANVAWRALAAAHRGDGADVSEGSNYLSLCDQLVGNEHVDAIAMAAGVRRVIAGERELFRYEYFCGAREPRYVVASVTRLRNDEKARAIVSYEDITQIKQSEQLLRLECVVARCLADADSTTAALPALIQAVCKTLRWDCGQYFRSDSESELLHLEH